MAIDPATGRFVAVPVLDRIADYFEVDGECWVWQGREAHGYGQVAVDTVLRSVHRVTWEQTVGPVSDGLELDHLCRNKMCINPDHLEPVTHAENVRRSNNAAGINFRKTHCVNGHALEGDNIYVPPKRPERRYCRICQNQRSRKADRSHKEVQP